MNFESLPIRVQAALHALEHTRSLASGGITMTPQGPQAVAAKHLSSAEQALANAAAEILRNFITGEMECADPEPRMPHATLRTNLSHCRKGPSKIDRSKSRESKGDGAQSNDATEGPIS
jgi:hypothetical protein